MNRELEDYLNLYQSIEIKQNEKGIKLSHMSLILIAIIPMLTTILAANLKWMPAFSYGFGKLAMLVIPFLIMNHIKKDWSVIQWKPAIISFLILGIAPLAFVCFGGLENLDASGIRTNMESLNLLPYFYLISFLLSFINAPLEEWFFRGYLHEELKKITSNHCFWTSFIFSLHHLAILVIYFDLTFALLFTFGTGVAGYVWSKMRDKGSSLMCLSVSHILCDLLVILLPGHLLLFK